MDTSEDILQSLMFYINLTMLSLDSTAYKLLVMSTTFIVRTWSLQPRVSGILKVVEPSVPLSNCLCFSS